MSNLGIGGIGLHVIVAIFFAVHAVRTHQNMYWLLLLFLFPGLGSIVYFFAVYLPSLRDSRGARAASRAIKQIVDPNRAVREAREAFDRAPTVDHRMRLGAALLEVGNAAEALEHYQAAANGPFASDPALLEGWRAPRLPRAAMPMRRPRLRSCLPRIRRRGTRPNPHCFTRVRCPRSMRPARATPSSAR